MLEYKLKKINLCCFMLEGSNLYCLLVVIVMMIVIFIFSVVLLFVIVCGMNVFLFFLILLVGFILFFILVNMIYSIYGKLFWGEECLFFFFSV